MPCQTDKLASGFSTRTLTPSRPLLAVVGVPVWELLSGGGKKRSRSSSPNRPTGGLWITEPCVCAAAAPGVSSAAARCTDTREPMGIGCVDGVGVRRRRRWGVCAVTAAAGGSSHQQRQADNKIRQNAAHQTSCLHGGDRSPYFGHALMLCCVWSFEEAATVCLYLSVLL